ncbi:galactose-binding domain-containing protein [Paenibacillus spongiae]|uniref:Discoidin domain-containing protein n=1 Tax=Paenibacillus spongiae TaxID=2909671 RepID=A0ABY5S779_9BACL|nr:discoidin domain-containing protein [Paenibacillus spongiae]UVI29767.1 discoidin domain-containing protein [Paenibacillus spongiae]
MAVGLQAPAFAKVEIKEKETHQMFPQSDKISKTVYTYNLDRLNNSAYSEEQAEGMMLALVSLQGLVNREKPEIYLKHSYDSIRNEYWILEHYKQKGYVKKEVEVTDPNDLFDRYKKEKLIKGLVVADPAKDYMINIATNIAGVDNLLIVYPDMVDSMKQLGFEVRIDLRQEAEMATATRAYKWVYERYWSRQRHDVLANVYYNTPHHYQRDYLIQFKIPTFWLSGPKDNNYTPELEDHIRYLLQHTPANIPVLGFWAATGTQPVKLDYPASMEDVAVGKQVTASGTWMDNVTVTPDKAVDGNSATRWASNTDAGTRWINVDLGEEKDLRYIIINWEASAPFRVEVSKDGVTYSEVGTYNGISNGKNTETLPEGTTGRYVRIASDSFLSIWTLQVIAPRAKGSPPSEPPLETVEMGVTEFGGVKLAGEYGKYTIVNDFAGNFSFHSGVPVSKNAFQQKSNRPPLTYDPNKKYVAVTMIESGDSTGYYQYGLKFFQWDQRERGNVAVNYGIAPAVKFLMPGVLEMLYETKTDDDYFFNAISGAGYSYPLLGYGSKGIMDADDTIIMDQSAILNDYFRQSDTYMRSMDLDMLGLYTHPWSGRNDAADDDFMNTYVLPNMNIDAIIADMGRNNETNASNANRMLQGEVPIFHNLTRWPSEDFYPTYDPAKDQGAVQALVKEIRDNMGNGQFMHAMAYSWHYGPDRIKQAEDILKVEGYVFVTLEAFEQLWRQSQQQ